MDLTGDDTLFFQYTGGTTGLSKAAVLSHRNLVANTEQFKAFMPEALEPGREVIVLALPLYHIFGLMVMIAYLATGAKCILIPNPRDMDSFIGTIKDAKFSVIPGVNTLFQGLAAHPGFKDVDLSRYKVAIGGGAAVIKATSEKWKALTGHHIKEGYGLSETSPVLCVNPMAVTEFTETCGLPVPSTEIKLIDLEENEVREGEAGEICARGPQVMAGYWNNAEANRSADPDQTMWEVYVLFDDVPDWGEKDKKLKLLAPPFKALGVWGTLRRNWANRFGRKATAEDGAAALAEHK